MPETGEPCASNEDCARARLLVLDSAAQQCSPHPNVLQPLEGKSDIGEVCFNFVNTVVGAGIVGLPFVFVQAGFGTALIELVVCCILAHISVKMLIDTGIEHNVRSYEDLCELALGRAGKVVVSLALFAFDYGALLTYEIILGDASSAVAYRFGGWGEDTPDDPNPRWVRQACIAGCSIVMILPFCLFRDISKLEKLSAISVFTVMVIIVIVIWKYLGSDYSSTHLSIVDAPFSGPGVFKSFSIIAFSFVCHDSAFLIFNTLRCPTSRRWSIVSALSLGSALGVCLLLAIPAFLTFGEKIKPNLLENYRITDDTVVFMRCVYVLTMAFTYPPSFFVMRHILNVWLFRDGSCLGTYQTVQLMPWQRHVALTLPIFFSALTITLFVDNLGNVMSLTGSLGAVVLAFVLPPLCRLAVDKQHSVFFWRDHSPVGSAKAVLPCISFILFGIIASIGSVIQVLFP